MPHASEKQPEQHLAKIQIPLEPGQWGHLKTEDVWAEPIGSGLYRVANIPFFAYGVNEGDIVTAQSTDGTLSFVGVSQRGGHSTYRLLLSGGASYESSQFLEHWRPLENIGCRFESAGKTWIAVDVPPNVDMNEVQSLLAKGQEEGIWNTDEGYCRAL